MGLFDRFKRNSLEINHVSPEQTYSGSAITNDPFVFHHRIGLSNIANTYLQAILNKLYSGISNISLETTSKNVNAEEICKFIENNACLIISQYIRLGYICIYYHEQKYQIVPDGKICRDSNGRVVNKNCIVYYSPLYQIERSSLMKRTFPILMKINKTAGTEDYLQETLGCFGILSGQDIPLNPEGKKQLLKSLKEDYGILSDKYQFLLTNNEMKYTSINPDIESLHLSEKVEDSYKLLCNLYGIPLPLIFDDAATYNNVSEAKVFFYDTTIREYAEVLLKVSKELLTMTDQFIPQSTITYHINNIPELEKTLSSAVEQRTTLLDYLLKLKDSGADVDKQLEQLYQDSKDLFTRL